MLLGELLVDSPDSMGGGVPHIITLWSPTFQAIPLDAGRVVSKISSQRGGKGVHT